MTFRPTRPPRGRLCRLGVVLDTRNAPARLREIAQMCDGAGIDALWVLDHLEAPDGAPRLEAWTALTLAAQATVRPRMGALLNPAFRPPATLAAMAGTLDVAIGGRLELALSVGQVEREHLAFGFDFPQLDVGLARLQEYGRIVRGLLRGEAASVGGGHDGTRAELGVASPQPGGPVLSAEAVTDHAMDVAAIVADDVIVPASAAGDIEATVARIMEACDRAGRDHSTIGIALEVPVSIGRTTAEAEARAFSEPMFQVVGTPREVGIFGTLEQCQERVIRFAHAGVTDLRCIIPNNPDVHDVIAQLTAITMGTVDVLTPNAPRSKSPDPPKTWGGRPTRR